MENIEKIKWNLFLFLFILLLKSGFIYSQDSIKVYFIGYFEKKEKYIVEYQGEIIQVFKIEEEYFADTFFIKIDPTIKDFECLDMRMLKLSGRLGKYKDTRLDIYYEPDRKYLIIWKDSRLKKKFSLSAKWVNDYYVKNYVMPEVKGIFRMYD